MKDFIHDLIKKAGDLALEYFNGIRPNEVFSKGTASDIVSTADKRVEQLIIETILSNYPDHGVYGEESGKKNMDSEYCWVIDPIDGTQSFVKKHCYFSISIAVLRKGETIAGAVYAPVLGQLFYAEKGGGAFLNGEPISVSCCSELKNAACATGFAYLREKTEHSGLSLFCDIVSQIRDIKRCGSAALDLCNIARGTYDGFWEYKLNLYDVAAGVLIAREAGAVITDYRGGGNFPENGIVVANPLLQPELLEYTKRF